MILGLDMHVSLVKATIYLPRQVRLAVRFGIMVQIIDLTITIHI